MQCKYLDFQNCKNLLPTIDGFDLISNLDQYLGNTINDVQGPYNGIVDFLIEHNKKTKGSSISSGRFCNSPLDIGVELNAMNDNIEFSSRIKNWNGPSLINIKIIYEDGQTWLVRCPLQFYLKEWGDATEGYQCYVHSISHKTSNPDVLPDKLDGYKFSKDDWHYVGITGRTWIQRLREHVREMKKDSPYKFHQTWKMSRWGEDTSFISILMEVNQSFEAAMNWEELRVDQLGNQALNMIPGGFKGNRELYKRRIIKNIQATPEKRDKAIKKHFKLNHKKEYGNPKIAEYWKSYDYYLKTIGARSKTLSKEQVQEILELHSQGKNVNYIMKKVKAINVRQVKNVIQGKTYKRMINI